MRFVRQSLRMPDSLVLHRRERRSKLYRNMLCIEIKKENFSLDTIVEAIMRYEYGSSVMVTGGNACTTTLVSQADCVS